MFEIVGVAAAELTVTLNTSASVVLASVITSLLASVPAAPVIVSLPSEPVTTSAVALLVSDLVRVRINYLFYLNYLQIIDNQ